MSSGKLSEPTNKLRTFMWDYDLDGQEENAETLAHLLANFAQIQEVLPQASQCTYVFIPI